ncbi:hypothetical protein MED297_16029 [Reinekea blandensis MED297]|uniref:RES domain-containing protein n=1 Tax=Reinekea blandensis MED297 TaxID=314283 RepID=A4BDS4_9GAMM|nr:hypothetical protein MED297_16029 [Reinekea blandensis MED297]
MPPVADTHQPSWTHHRVVHSRFPPTNLFDTVDLDDQRLLAELEGETNDRLMNWSEWLPADEFHSGPGWGAVMAAFCHFRPGRFNTVHFGAYYAADSVECAISEWSYHQAIFWRDHRFTDLADATVRAYTGKVTVPLVDVRSDVSLHQDDYQASQERGELGYRAGEPGFLFTSTRHPKGECIALLKPSATTAVTQAGHYSVHWDGETFTQYARLSDYWDIPRR